MGGSSTLSAFAGFAGRFDAAFVVHRGVVDFERHTEFP